MRRDGPKRRNRFMLSNAIRMAHTAAAPVMAGSALGSNTDKKRLSRVALAATCHAIIRPAARIAWRIIGDAAMVMLVSRRRALRGGHGRRWDRRTLFPGAPPVLAHDAHRHRHPRGRQHQVGDCKSF